VLLRLLLPLLLLLPPLLPWMQSLPEPQLLHVQAPASCSSDNALLECILAASSCCSTTGNHLSASAAPPSKKHVNITTYAWDYCRAQAKQSKATQQDIRSLLVHHWNIGLAEDNYGMIMHSQDTVAKAIWDLLVSVLTKTALAGGHQVCTIYLSRCVLPA
jgi:hypothetical protein